MINEEKRRTIERQYGALFVLDDKGKRISMFNEQGFARLFHASANPVYLPQENAFYLYEPQTGLWKQRSSEEMSDLLGLFCTNARKSGILHRWKASVSSPYCPAS